MAFVELKSPAPPSNAIAGAVADATALARGLGVTLGYLFQKPVTIQYPEQRDELPERLRVPGLFGGIARGLRASRGVALTAGPGTAAISAPPIEGLSAAAKLRGTAVKLAMEPASVMPSSSNCPSFFSV